MNDTPTTEDSMSDVQNLPSTSDPPPWLKATGVVLKYVFGWMGSIPAGMAKRLGDIAKKGWEALKDSPFVKEKSAALLIKAEADAEATVRKAVAEADAMLIEAEARARAEVIKAEGEFAVRIAEAEEKRANAAIRRAKAEQRREATAMAMKLGNAVLDQGMAGSINYSDAHIAITKGGAGRKSNPASDRKKTAPPNIILMPEIPKLADAERMAQAGEGVKEA
jgi:hypothetical protein